MYSINLYQFLQPDEAFKRRVSRLQHDVSEAVLKLISGVVPSHTEPIARVAIVLDNST